MKRSASVLDISDDIKDFFNKAKLFAIISVLPGYTLCSRINSALGVNFWRDRREDYFPLEEPQSNKPYSLSLFEEEQNTPYFPIYKTTIPVSNVQMFVYTNKYEGHRLLPQYSSADFLLLVRFYHLSSFEGTGIEILTKIDGINAVSHIQLNTLKDINNLIVQEPDQY